VAERKEAANAMTNAVFDALERRFKSNQRLRKLARKLYSGYGGEKVKSVMNHVEVTCTDTNNDFDTFDTEEPVYTLAFTVNSKSGRPDAAAEIMEELRRVYHNANLTSDAFDCCAMVMRAQSGPRLEDGTYRGEMTFELHASNKVHVPAEVRRVG
jgi:hypothetical protein